MSYSRSKKIWEESWAGNKEPISILAQELNSSESLAWKRIGAGIKEHFGSLAGLKVIEIGAGLGRAGARLAREGAKVTLIDFSSVALKKAEDLFKAAGLKADFLKVDIFTLPDNLRDEFDLAISFGLVEHFKADKRPRVFSIHTEVLRKGGLVVIGTPNAYGWPYMLWMRLARLMGAWEVGYEKAYTGREIELIMRSLGVSYRRWGTPFMETINTYIINKLNILLTNLIYLRKLRAKDSRKGVHKFIPFLKERWSCLDDWLGYHMIFIYK